MFLFKLMSEIPGCVENALKTVHGTTSWYIKPYLYIRLSLVALKSWSPYKRALIIIAYRKYEETITYRERLIAFGEAFAKDSFAINREDKIFIRHITKKEKMKAFFTPFNYIGRL